VTRSSENALGTVCRDLAAQIVADGEGVTYVAQVEVRGAASEAEAKAIAGRIATSPLVKTALNGRDANWGRILAAAGSATYNGGYAVHPFEPNARVGFSAKGTLKRSDFGIAYGIPAPGTNMGVSDEVEITIESEFTGPPLPKTQS